jgi:hypothetical protein
MGRPSRGESSEALAYHLLAALSSSRQAPSMHKKGYSSPSSLGSRICDVSKDKAIRGLILGRRSLTASLSLDLLGRTYSAGSVRPAGMTGAVSSNGRSGCIRKAQKQPNNNSPIDMMNGRYQLPVTSIT